MLRELAGALEAKQPQVFDLVAASIPENHRRWRRYADMALQGLVGFVVAGNVGL